MWDVKPYFTSALKGRVTMTTDSSKNGTITLSRANFSGYVGHRPTGWPKSRPKPLPNY